jgi:aspartate oxidase
MDSETIFTDDVLASGQSLSDEKLVHHLVDHAQEAIGFLESVGVNLDIISQCGGHTLPRTHRSKPDPTAKIQKNVGSVITSTLEAQLQNSLQISILTSSQVTKILTRSKISHFLQLPI